MSKTYVTLYKLLANKKNKSGSVKDLSVCYSVFTVPNIGSWNLYPALDIFKLGKNLKPKAIGLSSSSAPSIHVVSQSKHQSHHLPHTIFLQETLKHKRHINIYLCIHHMEMCWRQPLLNKPQLPEGLFFALKKCQRRCFIKCLIISNLFESAFVPCRPGE